MKIEINLSDFWLDEEEELLPALKKHIIQDTVAAVRNGINADVRDAIAQEVRITIESTLQEIILERAKEILEKETTKVDGEDMPLVTMIKNKFKNNVTTWAGRSMDQIVKDLAMSFAKDMKNRYDLLFASQFVAKMNENGMLKEDIAKLLLPQGEEQA